MAKLNMWMRARNRARILVDKFNNDPTNCIEQGEADWYANGYSAGYRAGLARAHIAARKRKKS